MKKIIAAMAAFAINLTSAAGISNATNDATSNNLGIDSEIMSYIENFDFAGHYEMVMQKIAENNERYQKINNRLNRYYDMSEYDNDEIVQPVTPATHETVISTTTEPQTTVAATTGPQPTIPQVTVPAATVPPSTTSNNPTGLFGPDEDSSSSQNSPTSATVPSVTVPISTFPTTPATTQPHIHEYQEVSRIEPSCTGIGHVQYMCSCGSNYGKKTSSLGHMWGYWRTTTAPTYDAPGVETRTCSRCGISDSIEIPKLVKKLSNEDAHAIADLTLQYINEIRVSEGSRSATSMPRCNDYAKLRSEQMAANGVADHSYEDSIAAATQLQYGRYIVPADYGLTGEPYYQVYGGEAVGTGYGKTIEEVARCLADGVHASPNHWSYVGKDVNIYMSIAVTYNKGCWYCCIITSTVNLDINPLGY